MEAVLFEDFEEGRIADVDREDCGADEVVVAVDRVQLSITECDLYHRKKKKHYETVAERLDEGNARLFGHEFCGHIVAIGRNVEEFAVGDRVYAPGKIPCTACPYCTSGYTHLCENKNGIGYETPGALAEYVVLPPDPLAKLPESVSDAEGAAMQPLASTLLAVQEAGIASGDTVVVYGTGVMGIQCGQLALLHGAEQVFCVDIDAWKLTIAEELGLQTIDARTADPVVTVRERTGGIGADIVFESVGGSQERVPGGDSPLSKAFEVVRQAGTIVQLGHIAGEISVTPRKFGSKMINWVNPRKGVIATGPNSDNGKLAAKLVADDRVLIEPYITHVLDGLSTFEDAIEITTNKQEYDALGPAQISVN